MEEKEVSVKVLIEAVTNDVRRNLKYIHSIAEVNEFKKYFEDMILFQTIGTAHVISAYADSKEATDNIATALIASGINPKGCLDRREKIEPYVAYHNSDNLIYAGKRTFDNQFEYLDFKEFGRKNAEVYAEVGSHKSIIDPSDLVKIAVSIKDIESGYVKPDSQYINSYLMQAKDMWKEEKKKYIEEGLTDKPYYKILCELFETNPQHHYPLVTKDTFEAVASFTYKLDNDLNVSISELQRMYRLNDASKIVDEDVLETYSKEVDKVMNEYVKRNKKHGRSRII